MLKCVLCGSEDERMTTEDDKPICWVCAVEGYFNVRIGDK